MLCAYNNCSSLEIIFCFLRRTCTAFSEPRAHCGLSSLCRAAPPPSSGGCRWEGTARIWSYWTECRPLPPTRSLSWGRCPWTEPSHRTSAPQWDGKKLCPGPQRSRCSARQTWFWSRRRGSGEVSEAPEKHWTLREGVLWQWNRGTGQREEPRQLTAEMGDNGGLTKM